MCLKPLAFDDHENLMSPLCDDRSCSINLARYGSYTVRAVGSRPKLTWQKRAVFAQMKRRLDRRYSRSFCSGPTDEVGEPQLRLTQLQLLFLSLCLGWLLAASAIGTELCLCLRRHFFPGFLFVPGLALA